MARSVHDLGLAAWFGGTLMGAVGLNPAAGESSAKADRMDVANEGWNRWSPVNAAAIGVHLAGSAMLLVGNKGRVAGQSGVAAASTTKLVLTGTALATTAYARMLGRRIDGEHVAVRDGTTPTLATPPEVARAQRQLKVLQWAIPIQVGALVVLNALMGEQQRPASVLPGMLARFTPGS